jgi:hypothetical protein
MQFHITLFDSNGIEDAVSSWVEARTVIAATGEAHALLKGHRLARRHECTLNKYMVSRASPTTGVMRVRATGDLDDGRTKDPPSHANGVES